MIGQLEQMMEEELKTIDDNLAKMDRPPLTEAYKAAVQMGIMIGIELSVKLHSDVINSELDNMQFSLLGDLGDCMNKSSKADANN